MNRIMFDTNAFDRLICDQFFPDVWQAASRGMLQLFTCEIQEQEIARIENKRKRCLIQSIPRQVIASAASCEASGNHLHHDPKQMPPDLVIAHTAAQYCSLFVTEDRQLLNGTGNTIPTSMVQTTSSLFAGFSSTL